MPLLPAKRLRLRVLGPVMPGPYLGRMEKKMETILMGYIRVYGVL